MSAWLMMTVAAMGVLGAPNEKDSPIRVLVVTGVDHPAHDWKKSAPVLRTVLEADKRIQVRITEDPELLGTDVPFDYHVLILHFKNHKPFAREKAIRANLVRFVKEGGGLVLLHFACGAFEDWPEFGDLAGKVWDRKTSHDPRGPFSVQVANDGHAITRGLKEFQTDDELYICLVGQRPVDLLLTARSRITGRDHPMAFAFSHGKGRVFHTSLGHDAKAIQMPGTAELLRRGSAWSAGREPGR